MADDVKMSGTAAAPIIDRFNNISAEFSNTRWDIIGYCSSISVACGEFSGSVGHGKDCFDLSWRSTFDLCSDTAALIAGNTNVFEVELHRLDRDAAHIPHL